MSSILAILALIPLFLLPTTRVDTVRIGLFGLFEPDALIVRVASGRGALLDGGPEARGGPLQPGHSIQIRADGARVGAVLLDPYGRVKQTIASTGLRISPDDSTTLELSLPGRMKRVVRGELSVAVKAKTSRDSLVIVLTTSCEAAVASVVAAEITGEREPEALKALAVVVRTFMATNSGRHAGEGFDYCDTTHCQFYRGESDLSAQSSSPVLAIAVARTAGELLSFGGRPIEGHYTSSCGGLTATPAMVWGGASGDVYSHRRVLCRWCGDSRFSKWERSAGAVAVLNALSAATGTRLSEAARLVVESERAGDFVRSVVITDRGRKISLSADEFRRAVGGRLGWNTVLSPTFTVERRGPSFIFRGRGFGSQVGLCLAGSAAQAAAGRNYREILSFYFPQAEVTGLRGRDEGQ